MQKPKFLLRFNSQTTFLEKICLSYKNIGIDNQVVVLSSYNFELFKQNNIRSDAKIAVNKHPEWERFYSVKTGLQLLSDNQNVLIHNVDNPFVSHELIQQLIENQYQADVIKPVYKGRGGHPVLVSAKVVRAILQTKDNNINLKDFLNQFTAYRLETNFAKIHVNINSPEIYKSYFPDNELY